MCVFFYMIRPPPITPRPDPIFPSPARVRPRTGRTGVSDLERRYTRFYHDANDAYASGDDATRSKTIAARFDALVAEAREPAALHALPNHDLRLLWRAASQAASSPARPEAAATALYIFAACERRGTVHRPDASEMCGPILAGTRFEHTRRSNTSHPA